MTGSPFLSQRRRPLVHCNKQYLSGAPTKPCASSHTYPWVDLSAQPFIVVKVAAKPIRQRSTLKGSPTAVTPPPSRQTTLCSPRPAAISARTANVLLFTRIQSRHLSGKSILGRSIRTATTDPYMRWFPICAIHAAPEYKRRCGNALESCVYGILCTTPMPPKSSVSQPIPASLSSNHKR